MFIIDSGNEWSKQTYKATRLQLSTFLNLYQPNQPRPPRANASKSSQKHVLLSQACPVENKLKINDFDAFALPSPPEGADRCHWSDDLESSDQ